MTAPADLAHVFSGDLATAATGDLLPAAGVDRANQRILRRLLTNPGDYLWHPDYGAGLPARIGSTFDAAEMEGLIRAQMFLEEAVAHDSEPEITLTPIPDGVRVAIRYTLAETQTPAALSFTVTP